MRPARGKLAALTAPCDNAPTRPNGCSAKRRLGFLLAWKRFSDRTSRCKSKAASLFRRRDGVLADEAYLLFLDSLEGAPDRQPNFPPDPPPVAHAGMSLAVT